MDFSPPNPQTFHKEDPSRVAIAIVTPPGAATAFVSEKPAPPWHHRARLFFGFATLMAIVVGTRALGYDRDYEQYAYMYATPQHILDHARYEPGFVAIIRWANLVGLDFRGFLLLVAFLTVTPKLDVLRRMSAGSTLPIAYYLSYFMIMQDQTAIRAGLSVTVLFVGYYLAIQRKQNVGFLVLAASPFFHQQATLPLLTILGTTVATRLRFFETKLTISFLALAFAASIFAILTLGRDVIIQTNDWAENYMDYPYYERARWYYPAAVQGAIMVFLGREAASHQDHSVRLSWFLGLLGVFLYYGLFNVGALVYRVADSFLVFNLLWLGPTMKDASPKTRSAMITCVVLFLMFYGYSAYYSTIPVLRDWADV